MRSLLLMAVCACGSSVEHQPSEPVDDEGLVNDYEAVAETAGNPETCSGDGAPTPTWPETAERNEDGSCFILNVPEADASAWPYEQKWVTTCKGSSCFCVENNVVVCACETDGAWCDDSIPSCCPEPFP